MFLHLYCSALLNMPNMEKSYRNNIIIMNVTNWPISGLAEGIVILKIAKLCYVVNISDTISGLVMTHLL